MNEMKKTELGLEDKIKLELSRKQDSLPVLIATSFLNDPYNSSKVVTDEYGNLYFENEKYMELTDDDKILISISNWFRKKYDNLIRKMSPRDYVDVLESIKFLVPIINFSPIHSCFINNTTMYIINTLDGYFDLEHGKIVHDIPSSLKPSFNYVIINSTSEIRKYISELGDDIYEVLEMIEDDMGEVDLSDLVDEYNDNDLFAYYEDEE